MVLKLGKA